MTIREKMLEIIDEQCVKITYRNEECPTFRMADQIEVADRILALIMPLEEENKQLREFVEETAREGYSTEVFVIKDCARRILAELDKEAES